MSLGARALNKSTARSRFALLTVLAIGGCRAHEHVQLPPLPNAAASQAVRLAYYEQHRVVREEVDTVIRMGPGGFSSGPAGRGFRLGDGALVEDAQDVANIVRSRSPAGRALRRARRLDRISLPIRSTAVAAALVGMALVGVGIAQGYNGETMRIVGASLGGSGVLVFFVDLAAFYWPAMIERERAMVLFNDSFRDRLGLCGDGSQIGDCASTTPPFNEPLPPTTVTDGTRARVPPRVDGDVHEPESTIRPDAGADTAPVTPAGGDSIDRSDAGP